MFPIRYFQKDYAYDDLNIVTSYSRTDIAGRIAYMAAQPQLGLWSKRWPGNAAYCSDYPDVAWVYINRGSTSLRKLVALRGI